MMHWPTPCSSSPPTRTTSAASSRKPGSTTGWPRSAGAPPTICASPGDDEWLARPLEHLAHYLTLLAVLDEAGALPDVRFQDTVSAASSRAGVAVDLLLDIGNSRTVAMLSEAGATAGLRDANAISLLPIRNLTQPWRVTRGVVWSSDAIRQAGLRQGGAFPLERTRQRVLLAEPGPHRNRSERTLKSSGSQRRPDRPVEPAPLPLG